MQGISRQLSAWQAHRQQRRMGGAAVATLVQRPAVEGAVERLRQWQICEPGNAAHPMTKASAMIFSIKLSSPHVSLPFRRLGIISRHDQLCQSPFKTVTTAMPVAVQDQQRRAAAAQVMQRQFCTACRLDVVYHTHTWTVPRAVAVLKFVLGRCCTEGLAVRWPINPPGDCMRSPSVPLLCSCNPRLQSSVCSRDCEEHCRQMNRLRTALVRCQINALVWHRGNGWSRLGYYQE
jgi:hypothetical protein